MNIDHPKNLGKSIEVDARNRPIKIAYLVPHDETSVNHMIINAVFHESYTRWGGAYTLIVPASSKEFLHSEYGAWLGVFDPDFIYAYLDLEPSLVETIDGLCSPIAFLKHNLRGIDPNDRGWRSYIPDWGHYFNPVSSKTTIKSPYNQRPFFWDQEPESEITIATQYPVQAESRLLKDNFGTAFDTHQVTYPIPGLYKTLSLVPLDLPKNHVAGTERCTTMTEMLTAISSRKALPIAKFAMVHSEAMPRVEPYRWSHGFNVFIGSKLLDRIHFWNARHLVPRHANSLGSLIFDAEFFNDTDALTNIGVYLNNHNFLGQQNGPARVSIRSYSQTKEILQSIAERLRKHTYNMVSVEPDFNYPALPEDKDFKESYIRGSVSRDTTTFKLTEDTNSLTPKEPSHFTFIPPRFKTLTNGQWIVELDIQRHNNLSKFANVIDTWVLPRRRKIVQAFTTNLGKVTSSHRLALLPASEGFPFGGGSINKPHFYSLSLPDDQTFFRYLLLDVYKYPKDDLRESIAKTVYKNLSISDKGQYLRGVISMFDSLSEAHEVLTNKYWRDVIRAANEDSVKYLMFTREQLEGFLPNDLPTKQKLMTQLALDSLRSVTRFMRNNLTDTLEQLIRIKVFFFVHQWRCQYCGHANSRGFDSMKIKNACEICDTEYLTPIDLEWIYQLNEFVYRSLVKHTGLPVLWTLGHLQDRMGSKSFWYLPEVDLFESYDSPEKKKEIDIVCVCDGKFIAVEVKLSASQLIKKPEELDSFIRKINIIQPDIAILSFEQYCDPGDAAAVASLKQIRVDARKRIDSRIKLEVITATDYQEFTDHPPYIGWYGSRTHRIQ